jgi:hypothetical protein
MRGITVSAFFVLTFASSAMTFGALEAAKSQEKVCTQAQENQAFSDIDRLKDWDSVYRSFRRFAQCDDGAIGEGYSDVVARLLAQNWKELSTLSRLASSDHAFQRFVLRHIDATDSGDDLKVIAKNARLHCPPAEKHLCSLIGAQSEIALKEIDESTK